MTLAQFDPTKPTAFELTHLSQVQDPYPIFDILRQTSPVMRTDDGYCIVTGYDAANEVMRDKAFGSGLIAMRFRHALPAGAAQDELAHRINFLDPPDHPRVRGLIMRAFTSACIRDMRPWVEQKANEIVDSIAERAASENQSFDLRKELAHALPSLVISEMLGVPIADRDMLTEWTEAVTPLLSVQIQPDQLTLALEASEQFAAYASELIQSRRRSMGTDLLSAMLEVKNGNETLSREELLSLVVTLYSAGHRTTRDLFANGLFTLLRHDGLYQRVSADPTLVPSTINEFLRYETPTLFVARVPTEDAQILGTPVDAYTPTLIMLGAANRDPGKYTHPHQFDVTRNHVVPLSFAAGPHHCLGAALARMEAEVMLAAVTRRWSNLRLAEPHPTWWSSGPFRGLDHLRVIASF